MEPLILLLAVVLVTLLWWRWRRRKRHQYADFAAQQTAEDVSLSRAVVRTESEFAEWRQAILSQRMAATPRRSFEALFEALEMLIARYRLRPEFSSEAVGVVATWRWLEGTVECDLDLDFHVTWEVDSGDEPSGSGVTVPSADLVITSRHVNVKTDHEAEKVVADLEGVSIARAVKALETKCLSRIDAVTDIGMTLD